MCKRTGFVNLMLERFCEKYRDSNLESLIVTGVESLGNKGDWSRVTIVFQRDSSRVTKICSSSPVTDSSPRVTPLLQIS